MRQGKRLWAASGCVVMIYRHLEDVVEHGIRDGKPDRTLSFIRREALKARTAAYRTTDHAASGIAVRLRGCYPREDALR